MTSPATCSHVWIDPDAPPIARRPLSPLIGAGPYAMKPDTQYRCRNCGWTIRTAPAPDRRGPVLMTPNWSAAVDALAIVLLVMASRALYWRWRLRRRRKADEYAESHKTWRGE